MNVLFYFTEKFHGIKDVINRSEETFSNFLMLSCTPGDSNQKRYDLFHEPTKIWRQQSLISFENSQHNISSSGETWISKVLFHFAEKSHGIEDEINRCNIF